MDRYIGWIGSQAGDGIIFSDKDGIIWSCSQQGLYKIPLTLLLGPAERVLNRWHDHYPSELKNALSTVRQNGYRLLNLVNQILDLRKLEEGQLSIQWVQGDRMLLLRYVADSFHSMAEQKKILFHFQNEPTSLWMDYDKDKLLKMVSNLLSNAFKFTPDGGAVTFSAQVSGDLRQIQVQDNGPGIAPEHLHRIFERFYQAPQKEAGAKVYCAFYVGHLPGQIKLGSVVRFIIGGHGGSMSDDGYQFDAAGGGGGASAVLVKQPGKSLFEKKTLYLNMNRFIEKIAAAKLDGTYIRTLNQIEKIPLLILDDFGLQPLDQNLRLALFQILEDRYAKKPIIVVSQLPVPQWHEYLNEPTLADAILDRLTANSHRIELQGNSMRQLSNS